MRRSKTGRSKWLQRDWESEIKAFFKGYWSEKKKKRTKKKKAYTNHMNKWASKTKIYRKVESKSWQANLTVIILCSESKPLI